MSRFISVALILLGSCGGANAQAIKCTAFLHNADGSWRSFENATVIGSRGKVAIAAGEIFRTSGPRDKADIAKILDSLCQ